MSVAEMKKQIIEKVETLSEKELNQLKEILDRIQPETKEYDLTEHVDEIILERAEVLKKLAQ